MSRRYASRAWIRVIAVALAFAGCSGDDADKNEPADSGRDQQLVKDAGPDSVDQAIDRQAEADLANEDAPEPDLETLPYPTPAAYWSMDAVDISGKALGDRAGSADGTIEGATKAEGRVGDGLALDGTDDFIGFGDVLGDVLAGSDKRFSISMWIKPTGDSGNVVLLAKNADASCDPDEDQRGVMTTITPLGNASLAFQPLVKGSPQLVTTEQPLPGGDWIHLVFVYDGSADDSPGDRGTIYVDGQLVATKGQGLGTFPFDIQPNDAHLGFGVRLSSSGTPCAEDGATFFAGIVDELAIWGEALSADDVTAIHARAGAGKSLM